jgi:diguanylate cyclase (GGDEF)-like protein
MPKIDWNIFLRLGGRLKRVCTLGNLGITPRLALAFASVAILAAASNLIVENGVSIVEFVTQPEPQVTAPEPVIVRTPAPAPSIDTRASRAQGVALENAESRVAASQLVLALGDFDKAVRAHVEPRSTDSATLYAQARTELRRLTSAYAEQHLRIKGGPPRALQFALQRHEKRAEALVQVANERRLLLASYSTIFSKMNARLHAALDGAWKIMGRVVARQSVLKLSAELDDIQNRFATRAAEGTTDSGFARLVSAEEAFATTLQENEATLRRSQGAEWFLEMRNDLTLLMASRISLAGVEDREGALSRTFSRETVRLIETVSRALTRSAPKDAAPAEVPIATIAVEARTADIPATASPPAVVPQVASRAPPQASTRAVVAWVSGIVLAVLAYICVITILSVVRPVRRLLVATTRLAQGGDAGPVALGGIRELDTLSQAFNVMAGQLAAARATNREVHQSLEAKVEERTRQLQELAERDPLTGLANRRQLFAALSASIARAAATNRLVGAFFLDLDNFKTLNDSMGHAYGDRVLTAIARRLEQTAHAFGFAARLGGDEFMLVHEGAPTMEEIVESGTRIVEAFHAPIQIDGRELIVSVSVGASVYPDHEQDAEGLLLAADAALFNAKALGRSQLTVFTPELLVKASAKFAIEQRLRRAIEKGEFELFYQPEIDVQSFEVSMVEALIRLRMPDGSYRGPGEFLAVAEESGLIMEISDWVLRTAIETASQWHHGVWPGVRVAINVAPRQFLDYRFVEKLEFLLAEFRLPAHCVELELTESVLQTGPTTIAALQQLRAIGVAIALDDFGTGYSSLASLEQLPLSRIKLDRSLIARMDSNPRSASIARATIGLCSELGLKVTAEGVERLEQFTALLGYPGMSLQGYLLGHPVARDSLLALLKRTPAHCQELVLMSRTQPAPISVPQRMEARTSSPAA